MEVEEKEIIDSRGLFLDLMTLKMLVETSLE
jgi:hypothetical protein